MSNRRKILASLLLLTAVVGIAGPATYSAFSSTTSNGGNSFSAGTVAISDNDAGGALLSLSSAKPSDSATGCLKVTYTGTLNANVRLYGSITGSLAPYLNLTVTRGTNSGGFNSCGTFIADTTNYVGAGAGVVYSGTLSNFASSYSDWTSGLVDPTSGSPATWTQNDVHAYKFVVSLANNNAAQGLSSTASFTWEAQNQ